ncbi:hypothetical protein [Streptomyces sp. NPDC020983]|uniref:hypothetical protein n=1 Tax=Streptomyces sp. NPDC020983 TaxID=3365106 RepID=UPI0037A25011
MGKSLRPSADFPGLHIASGSYSGAPTAEYVCRCGASDSATGTAAVQNLVAEYDDHKAAHAKDRRR